LEKLRSGGVNRDRTIRFGMSAFTSGQFAHPKYRDAEARIEAAAFTAGIPLGANGLTKERTEAAIGRGYRLIGGFDVLWLKSSVQQSIAWMNGTP
jgi:4-hydroxy-2-oxoheptanedioate aldolase